MSVEAIVDVIKTLRGPNGCPWDIQQTPRSMAVYLVEEVHEVVEAITSDDSEAVCEELGDALFQLLFLVHLYREQDAFNLEHVTEGIVTKMIRRHPHVFGDERITTAEDVKRNWQKIKADEKKRPNAEAVLASIASGLPALMRAYRVMERSGSAGLDRIRGMHTVIERVDEAWNAIKHRLLNATEVIDATDAESSLPMSYLWGECLLGIVDLARRSAVHPDIALADATARFEKRFQELVGNLCDHNQALASCDVSELHRIWKQAAVSFGEKKHPAVSDIQTQSGK